MPLTAKHPSNKEYAQQVIDYLPGATYEQALKVYDQVLNDPCLDDFVVAEIGKYDRFFFMAMLLRVGENSNRVWHPWVYDRCREVQDKPDGHLDFWAREHWKSSIITFAGSLQEIAINPEITIGIFSHNTSHSRDRFVLRLKREMEQNPNLPRYYPDIFYENPKKDAPIWSRDSGLIVKRNSNPAEPTISGWGLVDGQPTGSHFGLIIYDDVVTEKSVTSPDMILKTTEMWELSLFMRGEPQNPEDQPRVWYIGTRYNFADTYAVMLQREIATPRIYPATDDGLPDGNPVYLSETQWNQKKKEVSSQTLACQMLQNPLAGQEQEFKPDWIRRWEVRPKTLNVAILVDPASSKKKGTSNTAFAVIGIGHGLNKYLLDGACHKMSLTERWEMLKYLRAKWMRQPGIQTVAVGYEKYGMQSDIEHFHEMMILENNHFPITELNWPREGLDSKDDRIRRLIPDHQNWRFFYPWEPDPNKPNEVDTPLMRKADENNNSYLIAKPIKRKNHNGQIYNVVDWFLRNEYLFFPATTSKDFFDAMSRIYDMEINAPMIYNEEDLLPDPDLFGS